VRFGTAEPTAPLLQPEHTPVIPDPGFFFARFADPSSLSIARVPSGSCSMLGVGRVSVLAPRQVYRTTRLLCSPV